MNERDFLARLRALPLHPGARGLVDDAAVLGGYVVTADTLVEGVHFLPGDPPADVAWKLVATNLSDLAAKGARPEGVMLSYPLSAAAWDAAFLAGFGEALAALACPLLGGDTVTLPEGAPRVLALTAFGADAVAPSRDGARAGDALWVTGVIGDAGAGLAIALEQERPTPSARPELVEGRVRSMCFDRLGTNGRGGTSDQACLLTAYRRPHPRIGEGRALGPVVHAMMDVSDGLLIDAARMAAASGVAVAIDLAAVPLSPACRRARGEDRAARLVAATAGDDYELLFALPPGIAPPVPATRIGGFAPGAGLSLTYHGRPVPLPDTLGFEHGLR